MLLAVEDKSPALHKKVTGYARPPLEGRRVPHDAPGRGLRQEKWSRSVQPQARDDAQRASFLCAGHAARQAGRHEIPGGAAAYLINFQLEFSGLSSGVYALSLRGAPTARIKALLGKSVVPFTLAGVKSEAQRLRPGGRRAADRLAEPCRYEAVLRDALVLADVVERRRALLNCLEQSAKAAGGAWTRRACSKRPSS